VSGPPSESTPSPPVPKPELLLNRADEPGGTVAAGLNGFIEHAATAYREPLRLDIATAYFNLGGYTLLADSLDRLSETRILLGAEPEAPENRPRRLRPAAGRHRAGKAGTPQHDGFAHAASARIASGASATAQGRLQHSSTAPSSTARSSSSNAPAAPNGRAEPADPERAEQVRLSEALTAGRRSLITERDQLGFSRETSAAQQRLVAWLRSKGVQVRRLETRFLHGKAFLAGTHDHGVIAGSSNFTYAGLARNEELNLGSYTPAAVRGVQAWYDELWDEAAEFDLAALFAERDEPHPPQLIYLRMLWERYASELHEEAGGGPIRLTQFQADGVWRAERILERHNGVLIADEVGLGKTFIAGALIEKAAIGRRQRVLVITPATLRDGPWEAFRSSFNLPMELVSFEDVAADGRLSDTRTGVKLKSDPADYSMVVVDEAHNLRNPATQRAGAVRRLLAGSPPKQVVLLTATPVNNSLMDLYHQLGYFVRNDAALAELGIASLRGRFDDAMDIKPDDLSPDLLFDVLDTLAVRRTRSFVKRWYRNDRITVGGEERQIEFPTPRVLKVSYDLDGVLPGFFDRIALALDPDVEPADAVGDRSGPVEDPDLAATGPRAGANSSGNARALGSSSPGYAEGVLSLARYEPSRYLKDPDQDAAGYERRIAGLLRSGMLKRFESSPHAFANTCDKMAKSCESFVSLISNGWVATGEALADWAATDSDDLDDLDIWLDHHAGSMAKASLYHSELLAELAASDAGLLRELAKEARKVSRQTDPNLKALRDELAEIAARAAREGIGEADVRNRRKVLIFSYFADTVEWIYDYLLEAVESDERLAAYRGRLASLTGSSALGTTGASNRSDVRTGEPEVFATQANRGSRAGPEGLPEGDREATTSAMSADARGEVGPERPMVITMSKERVVWGFAPITSEAPANAAEDLFDILVCTDVLAEGVNLQQAANIVNYDLPWNPMRLVQRHGRIDRIGALHDEVFIRCVFPDTRLNDLLNLEERLHRKIKQAAASIGTPQVLPHQQGRDRTYSETRSEIERLQREEAAIFEEGRTKGGALSGEEFRAELRHAIEQHRMQEEIASLPYGSGSGFAASSETLATGRRGYVFCIRVADDPKVLFRYVELDLAEQLSGRGMSSSDSASDRAGGESATGDTATRDTATGNPDTGITNDGRAGLDRARANGPTGGTDSPSEQATGKVEVRQKTLECLEAARPPGGLDAPRVLDDATKERAYDAWEIARSDVLNAWAPMTDKANLEPKIPKVLHDAIRVLRENRPAGFTQEAVDAAADALSAPYGQRELRAVREALRSSEMPAEQALKVMEVVDTLGLQPYVPPEPWPPITSDDVQLVCWQALTPASDT